MPRFLSTHLLAMSLSVALSLAGTPNAARGQPRHGFEASAGSALSVMMPVAVSVAASAEILSAGGVLTVISVQSAAAGTVWFLERASDGARASISFAAAAAKASAVGVGSAVIVTALSAGWVLSTAGKAIAFIPNEVGAALLYNEHVTR